jgi:hypothetical protein
MSRETPQSYKIENLVKGAESAAFDSQIIRQGLFAHRDAGIAIVTNKLEIVDCNHAFAAIVLGKDLKQEKLEQYWPDASNLKGAMLRRYISNTVEEKYLLLALQHLANAVFSKFHISTCLCQL